MKVTVSRDNLFEDSFAQVMQKLMLKHLNRSFHFYIPQTNFEEGYKRDIEWLVFVEAYELLPQVSIDYIETLYTLLTPGVDVSNIHFVNLNSQSAESPCVPLVMCMFSKGN